MRKTNALAWVIVGLSIEGCCFAPAPEIAPTPVVAPAIVAPTPPPAPAPPPEPVVPPEELVGVGSLSALQLPEIAEEKAAQ